MAECGDSCSSCAPDDNDCVAIGAPTFCTEEMECKPGLPTCDEKDLCADFIPPCSTDEECPGDMVCSFAGCNPSSAFCDPETGDIIATADCGGGMCVEK